VTERPPIHRFLSPLLTAFEIWLTDYKKVLSALADLAKSNRVEHFYVGRVQLRSRGRGPAEHRLHDRRQTRGGTS